MSKQVPLTRSDALPFERPPLWLLALITFSGTLAMHIFVPALPILARDLGTNSGTAQLSISFYILGLAFGQLIIGPLSDRYGRRPALIAGLLLYTAAGFVAATASNIQVLVVARMFQALGGCAGLVLGRAIARDGATPVEAARRLALMNLIAIIGPGAAPIIGNAIAETAGWRAILFCLCALGFANTVMTWRLLSETGYPSEGLNAAKIIGAYRRLARSREFLGFAIGGGFATTTLYAFIAAAPFILIRQLHCSSHEVAIYLALILGGCWIGTLAASRLSRYVGRLMVKGTCVSLAAASVLLASVMTGHMSVLLTMGCMIIFGAGSSLASPSALAEAIGIDPRAVGSASGLYGFFQMTIGAICTALAGVGADPAMATSLVLVSGCLIALASFWIAIRAARSNPAPHLAETPP